MQGARKEDRLTKSIDKNKAGHRSDLCPAFRIFSQQ